jgi:hypothetical protein
MDLDGALENVRDNYLGFIDSCRKTETNFSLTPHAEATPYARCFAIYGLNLLQEKERLSDERGAMTAALLEGIRAARQRYDEPPGDKPYRQLLTFTLSALAILGGLEADPLHDLVMEQIPADVAASLSDNGALEGRAQSGNQAMFMAIFLLYARDWLGVDLSPQLDTWVELHIAKINRFGFWGEASGICHLHFQNGYHQYEIFEYLGIAHPRHDETLTALSSLADRKGHFAPYPGGGGCYDYDAIFLLTPEGRVPDSKINGLLGSTLSTLLSEQNPDGGWCESQSVRPRGVEQLTGFATHVLAALPNRKLFVERLRYALALQRPLHNRIHTHWSEYSRRWNESDLWDSWFRMLAIARIDVARDAGRASEWGFIDFPGIGYHPSLRNSGEG